MSNNSFILLLVHVRMREQADSTGRTLGAHPTACNFRLPLSQVNNLNGGKPLFWDSKLYGAQQPLHASASCTQIASKAESFWRSGRWLL